MIQNSFTYIVLIVGSLFVSCHSTKLYNLGQDRENDLLQIEKSITLKDNFPNNKFSIITMEHERTERDMFFDMDLLAKVDPWTQNGILDDGTIIRMFWSDVHGGYLWEAPPSKFYKIYRTYDLNKKIKSRGFVISNSGLPIGLWEYYDESGYKTIEDKDKQLPKKFDYNKVYLFLAKEGYVDLRTGEGRENISLGYDPEKNIWDATVKPSLENKGGYGYSYILDGSSGKVINIMKVVPLM